MSSLGSSTFLISGPVGTRLEELLLIQRFEAIKEISRRTNMSLAITTYVDEPIPLQISNMCRVTRISDPGIDKNTRSDREGTIDMRNTSRMLACTIAGLLEVETEYVIKSRIEVLPKNSNFESSVERALTDLEIHPERFMSFVAMHYQSLGMNTKSAFLFMPDIFQVMRTNQALELWKGAQNYWETYGKKWSAQRKVITNEQIMGLSLAKLTNQELNKKDLENFYRNKFNKEIFLIQQDFERNRILTLQCQSLSFFDSRLTSIDNYPQVQLDKIIFPDPSKKSSNYYFYRMKYEFFRLLKLLNRIRASNKLLTKAYWKQRLG